MAIHWRIISAGRPVPDHEPFTSLAQVREFLVANGVTISDRDWDVVESLDTTGHEQRMPAAVLVSDQGREAHSLLEIVAKRERL